MAKRNKRAVVNKSRVNVTIRGACGKINAHQPILIRFIMVLFMNLACVDENADSKSKYSNQPEAFHANTLVKVVKS